MKGTVLFLTLLLAVTALKADPRQWNPMGLSIRQGNFTEWSAGEGATAADAAGNTIMVWSDNRNGSRDVFAQLISPEGTTLWTAGGRDITPVPGNQAYPAVCSVADGWIIGWVDYRSDSMGDVWALKVDNSGSPLWPGNNGTGMPVDANPSWIEEYSVRIVPDGSGGAILAWQDNGIGPGDIYAQRMSSNGEVAWNDRLPVVALSGAQNRLSADGDVSGNMLVAWQDDRNSDNRDIYAAKITPDGQAPWGANGTLVCAAANTQSQPHLCTDGADGCNIVWRDSRNESYGYDLYAQRLNGSGDPQWQTNGVVVCDAPQVQENPWVAASRNGGAEDGCLVVWEDYRASESWSISEIYAQKISPQGTAIWTANGVHVCGDAAPGQGHPRRNPRVISDQAGGLVCAWDDWRENDDYPYADIYAERITASGTMIWGGECGVLVADGNSRQSDAVLSYVAGNILAVYGDGRSGSASLRFQKLQMASGNRLLDPNGIVVLSGIDNDANDPQAVPMTPGRTAIVWKDNRYGTALYNQIINNQGEIEKPLHGVPLVPDNEGFPNRSQENARLCSDGNGGFFCSFEDNRSGTKMIRLTRVNSAGDIACSEAANIVYHDAATMSDQIDAYVAPDGSGGCYVAWSNYDREYYIDVYMMHLGADCQPLWDLPVRLTESLDDDMVYGLVPDPEGCATVAWKSGPYGSFNIQAARVCADGTIAYSRVVCNAPDDQEEPAIVSDGSGGAYIAWTDKRSTEAWNNDIYAQRLSPQGTELWAHNGICVISDTLWQVHPTVARSGEGNLYVVWEDYRSAEYLHLYAQKITPAGTLVWPDSGVVLCNTGDGDKEQVSLVPDNGDGFFAAWRDVRGGGWGRVYSTHLGPDGNPIGDPYWVPQSGGPLTNITGRSQYYPQITSDGAGGMVAVWDDQRGSGEFPITNIYAQHVMDAAAADEQIPRVPAAYALAQNYPNPFNPTTKIRFDLPKAGQVNLKVYDLLGREVTTLVSRALPAGVHTVSFDGGSLASGIYFYRIESGAFKQTHKMVLLR